MRLPLFARRRSDADDNMIPLINIVFLLLIFFMIAGKISSDAAFPLALPNSEQAAPVPERNLEVLVDRDGRIALDGVLVAREQLADALTQITAGGAVAVALKADASLKAEMLAPVLRSLRNSGVQTVRLYTQRGDAP